ncbi:MAG: hypothetical protein ACYS8W_15060, partial [Planctomycetota bacterium]
MSIEQVIRPGERGYAMIMALFAMLVAVALCMAAAMLVQTETRDADFHGKLRQAKQAALAGLERGTSVIADALKGLALDDPFGSIDGLDGAILFTDEPLMSGSDLIGQYSLEFDVLPYTGPGSVSPQTDDDCWRDILIKVTAVASPGSRLEARRKAELLVRVELSASEVFDYAYFINHWGWWYGSSIYGYGNIRANGQFDFGGYRPTVNGRPRFRYVNSGPPFDLIDYIDDNGDGLKNGLDGGVYAGWNIINNSGVKGNPNFYPWQEQIPMPNLSNLSYYENVACSKSGSIAIAGYTIIDGVLGDDAGESRNGYLEGTAQNPIILDGPVVVRG